ncbi:autophagy-related protein 13 [Lingula anatina]|uniref:Autophagy-related protein 13 n=1 Tax=Lingula anatina TaxID=7574 RepID=A0A1S3HZQ2_LINAN|nr:autophagy-related protein 13 [Lingula anatina]|eukprot:XP_013390569.1 autophagy-related protein 13 [Lingula anatina]
MATQTKLSAQERKDLDRFTKFFVYKAVQIIVQSRLGEKVRTSSKPASTGADWFNLAIRDIQEVQNETKKVVSGQQLTVGSHICVEVSLKTAEGDSMILETWHIGMTEQTDPNVKVSYSVYNRMGILLKSLFCVTRVTPAYRLSRRQGPDNYVICYRVYQGEPQVYALGDGYQKMKVGSVGTPTGTIALGGAYRVKMLISPHSSCKDLATELKDDHFKSDTSPKRVATPKPCYQGYKSHRSSTEDIAPSTSDSQELCATTFSTSPADPLYSPSAQQDLNSPPRSHPIKIQKKLSFENKNEVFKPQSAPEKIISLTQDHKLGAFAPSKPPEQKSVDDLPFVTLLLHNEGDSTDNDNTASSTSNKDNSDMTDNVMGSTGSGTSNKSISSGASCSEDFVLVELKTPFAAADSNTDLGKFVRDCQAPPLLSMFEEQPTVEETLDQITQQLAMFESTMPEFDDFVNSLQTTEA